jgi:hypothetical protein
LNTLKGMVMYMEMIMAPSTKVSYKVVHSDVEVLLDCACYSKAALRSTTKKIVMTS